MVFPAGIAATADGYEQAIARIPELEVDLASAVTSLERVQADNAALRGIQTDLTNAYKRLQEQHEQLREERRKEQLRTEEQIEEQRSTAANLRSKLDAKIKECEALQDKGLTPRDIDSIRLQHAEEIEEPWLQKVKSLETKLVAEQRASCELQRKLEMQKAQGAQKVQEMKDEMTEVQHRQSLREQALERQITHLQGDVENYAREVETANLVQSRLHDQEGKVATLTKAIQEQEQQVQRERVAAADELKARIEEVSAARRRANDMQIEREKEERRSEQLLAQCETLRAEHTKLYAQIEQAREDAKAREANLRPVEEVERLRRELIQQRTASAAEHDQLLKTIKTKDEQLQAANAAVRRAEAQIHQLSEEMAAGEQEARTDREDAERRFQEKVSTLQSQLDISENEAESRRQSYREKEFALMRQIDAATLQCDALNDDLLQCRAARQEHEQKLIELERQHHQHEETLKLELRQKDESFRGEIARRDAQVNGLQERAEKSERELLEQKRVADALRSELRKQEQNNSSLQAELLSLSGRIADERDRWRRDLDEGHQASLNAAEEKHSAAMQQLSDEHRRQLAKLHSTSKKTLQKAAQKRQELRHKYQELAKRAVQIEAERATAIRICEENKQMFEIRLAEAAALSSSGVWAERPTTAFVPQRAAKAPTLGSGGSSVELRAIAEHLEKNAEWLRSRGSDSPTMASSAGLPDSLRTSRLPESLRASHDLPLGNPSRQREQPCIDQPSR